ncbi:MAG: hypothetical protein ACI8P3_002111, partial [Saprospiraceae bacterium]
MLKIKFLFIFLLAGTLLSAQPDRWQQRMECTMNIDFEVRK